MAKFKFYVSTRYAGSKREEVVQIDDEDLEGLNEEDREKFLWKMYEEWLWENTNTGWEEA